MEIQPIIDAGLLILLTGFVLLTISVVRGMIRLNRLRRQFYAEVDAMRRSAENGGE